MANLTVNRMTLINKRNSRSFAFKGSELLQAKRNALLIELQKTNRLLEGLDEKLNELRTKAFASFTTTVAIDGTGAFPFAQSLLTSKLNLSLSEKNIFGTRTAVLEKINIPENKAVTADAISSRLHASRREVAEYVHVLIEYSFLWSKREKIKLEIQKTNRRLNFLCLRLIPRISNDIKYIELGLEARELENIVKQKKLKKRKKTWNS